MSEWMARRSTCAFPHPRCSALESTARRLACIPGKLDSWFPPTRILKLRCDRRRNVNCKRPPWPMAYCEPPSKTRRRRSPACCRAWGSRRLTSTKAMMPRLFLLQEPSHCFVDRRHLDHLRTSDARYRDAPSVNCARRVDAFVISTLCVLIGFDQSTRFPASPDCVTPERSLPGLVSVIDQTASIASLRLAWMAMCCFLSKTPPAVLHPGRNAHAATR